MMAKNLTGIIVAGTALVLGSPAHAGDGPHEGEATFAEAFGFRSTMGLDRDAYRERIERLHAFVDAERPPEVASAPVVVLLTDAERRSIDAPHTDPRLVKVGFSKALTTPVAFARGRQRGVLAPTDDGGFVWAVAISSPGASAVRLQFANVSLPDDADLYIYNEFGDVKGPYQGEGPNGTGTFWSHTLAGDTVIVQLRYFGEATEADVRATSVAVTHVGHLTSKFGAVASPEAFCSSPDGGNAVCVDDASCYSEPAVADAKDAVALMLWPQGPFFFICSGGLLADTARSSTPYFLTAHHCISSRKDAQNLETHFHFATGSCSSSYPIACEDWRGLIGTGVLGSTLLATSSGSDFTLLQLSGAPPSGSAFLGWTSSPVASSGGAALHRISHPNAAPQAYSRHRVDPNAVTCSSIPRGNFIYSRDEVGATEGGSSGSPVVNGSGQVVGQLYGACGFNVDDVCDAGSNATVDGAFASYWAQVQPFLDPGVPPPPPPATEVCDDGADNDGDGLADCADPDCTGDPACGGETCTSGAKFDPCTSDADCCSNKCRGPPSGKSCR